MRVSTAFSSGRHQNRKGFDAQGHGLDINDQQGEEDDRGKCVALCLKRQMQMVEVPDFTHSLLL